MKVVRPKLNVVRTRFTASHFISLPIPRRYALARSIESA